MILFGYYHVDHEVTGMLKRVFTIVGGSFGIVVLTALLVWIIRINADVGWTNFKDKGLWDLLARISQIG